MKKRQSKRQIAIILAVVLAFAMLAGCSRKQVLIEEEEEALRENVIITETGEVIEKQEDQMEEENLQALEESTQKPEGEELLEQSEETKAPTPTVEITEKLEISYQEPEQVISEEDQIEPTGSDLQLVFLGDSIFDSARDGTGIPYLTAVQCEADVFNLAIGGTCATLEKDENRDPTTWSSWNLPIVVNALMGNVPAEHFAGLRAGEILANPDIDYSNTDYFIIEYGTNDFLSGKDRSDQGDHFNLNSYAGALRYAIANLSNIAPDATFILCSPCYAQFYNGDWMIGDGNVVNNGYGTLFDYKGTCNYIAKEQNTLFLNAYEDLGIDGYTADEYLEDGIHLTEAGRQLYADALAKMILKYEETKNN